jgi:hypothetical protein
MKILKTISEYYVPTLGSLADLGQSTAKGNIVWKEQDVFERIVTEKKGYGTVCFGHGFLFRGILRALGYR